MSEQEWVEALSEEVHVNLRALRELSRFGNVPDQACLLSSLRDATLTQRLHSRDAAS